MDKAYIKPKDSINGNESPKALANKMEPVNKIAVRSIFVSPEPYATIKKGERIEVQGLAFDGGDGITKVEISSDKGKTWMSTRLDASLGNYSWRRWRYELTPSSKEKLELLVKATNAAGTTQPWRQWNRSGYLRNEIESLTLTVR